MMIPTTQRTLFTLKSSWGHCGSRFHGIGPPRPFLTRDQQKLRGGVNKENLIFYCRKPYSIAPHTQETSIHTKGDLECEGVSDVTVTLTLSTHP